MLDASILSQLTTHFANLVTEVELVTFLDDSAVSQQTAELVAELAELSPRIAVVGGDTNTEVSRRVPSFEVRRAADHGVAATFAGLPMGHEFTSLVLAVLHVGGHPSKVAAALAEQIAGIEGTLAFETYFSQSCQNCPDVVQALNLMSVLNPGISHVAIDGGSFASEVDERNVQSVPAVFLNGEVFGFGRMTLEEIVAKVDTGAAERAATALADADPFDVLIVGAGPAGAAAAVYAARKGVRTGMVAGRLGGQVLDTMAIENLISVPHTEGPALARALESHVREYDVEVMVPHDAVGLTPDPGDGLHRVELASGATLRARTVVLAPGASWRSMNVPGEAEYRNKGVTFCPHCDGPLFKGKRVAVIGGGNSGIEAAIDLAGLAAHVTVVEFGDELRADAVLQRSLDRLANVDIVVNAQTTEVLGDGRNVTGIIYTDRATNESHTVELDGVFVQIGLVPNTAWLDGVVDLERGEIVIDHRGTTSVPGVFAAGDATIEPYKQIIVAAGAGASAALGAFDHLIRTPAPTPVPA
ncbi:MAG: alkyl hydroperoxide reductase subunit F [Ilumatobacteraceae bacterium]